LAYEKATTAVYKKTNSVPQLPPAFVPVSLLSLATENFPAPGIDQNSKRQESDLLQGKFQQGVD